MDEQCQVFAHRLPTGKEGAIHSLTTANPQVANTLCTGYK